MKQIDLRIVFKSVSLPALPRTIKVNKKMPLQGKRIEQRETSTLKATTFHNNL